MNKQTAVEWLVKEFSEILGPLNTKPMQDLLIVDAIKQAKEMEEKNLKDSFVAGAGMGEMFNNENRCYVSDAEKYLKETFKSE